VNSHNPKEETVPLTTRTKTWPSHRRVQTIRPGRLGREPGYWTVQGGRAVHVGKKPGRRPYSSA
jgi:hypothetical protein